MCIVLVLAFIDHKLAICIRRGNLLSWSNCFTIVSRIIDKESKYLSSKINVSTMKFNIPSYFPSCFRVLQKWQCVIFSTFLHHASSSCRAITNSGDDVLEARRLRYESK